MKLNPQQAPLYGDCVLTVLLAEEDKVEDDVVFYLVFSGSTLHHCTSTRKISSDTLETIAPGHDCCETVKVQLCASKKGLPIFVVAEEDFHFVQDEAYDAAQFLATSAGNQQALNFTRFLDRSGPPSGDVNSLDEKVALAFRHLKLPAEWNVLGTHHTLHDGGPRETLMHFAVRLGLLRLAWFLLQKPGGRGALSIHNQEGATPVSLALERGYHKLHQLLTEENAGEPDSWSSLSYEIPFEDCSVRHHRELDIYMLTSEAKSHCEPPFPEDGCSGHIFKLRNIQQQLMKTNLKEMDNLVPVIVTPEERSRLPSALTTDVQLLSCAAEPSDSPQLSFPTDETESKHMCCQGSPVSQIESSCDVSTVVEEENTDCSYRGKSKGMEREGEEVEPTPITVSDQDSCLQRKPECEVTSEEGLLSCGNRNGEAGTESSKMATDPDTLSNGGSVLDMVMEPDSGLHSSECKLADISADARIPETAQQVSLAATIQNSMLQAGENTKKRLENSDANTAGASNIQVIGEPVDEACVPSCASATSAIGGSKPVMSSLALSSGGTSIEKTAETETLRSCEEYTSTLRDQNSVIVPAAAKKISDVLEPDTLVRGVCEAISPSDIVFPGLEKGVMTNQKSETNLLSAQSQNRKSLICTTTGDDKLCADSTCQQKTVSSSGELVAQRCSEVIGQPQITTKGQSNKQDPPSAVCSEDAQAHTVISELLRNTQEHVDFCLLETSDKKDQEKDLKLDTPLTNRLEVASHLYPLVPKTKKELVPNQAVLSDSTFSLAGSLRSESVTKDDVLSLVPSQKEKGTATPELHIACREGPGGEDSDHPHKQALEGSVAGLATSSTAIELQPSMGNISPGGVGGEQEDPGSSAASEFPIDSSVSVDKSTLASDSVLTEEIKNVVPEISASQEQDDKDEAVICSSVKEETLSSGVLVEEQKILPPKQEALGFHEKTFSAACAKDKVLQHNNSPVTPTACLETETELDKEVAPQVSLLTEGGAIQSRLPLGTSLNADSSQEALGAQHNSPLLLGMLPDETETPRYNQRIAQDVGGKDPQTQATNNVCEVSGNIAQGVAVVNRLQDCVGPRRKNVSHNIQDIPVSEISLSQDNNIIPSLPGDLSDKDVVGPLGAAAPEMAALDWKQGKQEGADHSCTAEGFKEAQMDEKTLEPVGRELLTETELSTLNDKALVGTREVTQISDPGQEIIAPSLPCTVSTQAVHVPEGKDLIEETASHIVEAVIEEVKASRTLIAEGEISHMSLSSPKSSHLTEQLEMAPTEKVYASLPGEPPQMDCTGEEAMGNFKGPFVQREEPEKIILPFQDPDGATDMPDTKTEDEVDFLSIRVSSDSEEVAVGNGASTPKMKQGLETQVESSV
ncbi:A-kinase anchor protein 13-like [Ctenodactylus gundi]